MAGTAQAWGPAGIALPERRRDLEVGPAALTDDAYRAALLVVRCHGPQPLLLRREPGAEPLLRVAARQATMDQELRRLRLHVEPDNHLTGVTAKLAQPLVRCHEMLCPVAARAGTLIGDLEVECLSSAGFVHHIHRSSLVRSPVASGLAQKTLAAAVRSPSATQCDEPPLVWQRPVYDCCAACHVFDVDSARTLAGPTGGGTLGPALAFGVLAVTAALTAAVATAKGRSAPLWLLLAVLFPIVALLVVFLLPDRSEDSHAAPEAVEAVRSSPVARSLARRPGCTPHELQASTRLDEREVIEHLVGLRDLGAAEADPTGRWRLTERGRHYLTHPTDRP
jgi:hypothetical protein